MIEAARDVATRAGVPLEAWIASVVPQAATPADRLGETQAAVAAAEPSSAAAATETSSYPAGLNVLLSRLDGLDRSMEAERRAEQRRLEEIEARIDRALHTGPVQQVTERLGDIERRVAQLGDQVSHTRPPGKRGKVAAEEMREAVQEIRQRQRELSEQAQPEAPVATIHRDIVRRLGAASAPARRPIGLPAYVAEELQREASRLREALTRLPSTDDVGALEQAVSSLAEGIGRAHSGVDLAAIATPIEVIRARVEQLSATASSAMHEEVAADIQHFSGRLDVAAAFDDPTAEGSALRGLFAELTEIRGIVSGLAAPERVDGLITHVRSLSAGISPADEAELRPILEEIRSEETGIGTGALADEIHALVARVDTLQATADAEAAERAAAEAARAEAAAVSPGDVASIHAMLHSLAEKVDRVNERAGTEGLDALERHVLTLVDRIEAPHALDPTITGLERTMTDLMQQVEALRMASPNEEQIERATRNAVTETLQAVTSTASGGDIGLLRASLADMQARQIASDERLSTTLEGVQTALDRLVNRLGAAEHASAPRPPSLDERLLASTSTEATLTARRPAPFVAEEAVAFTEALLEPGAPRPALTPILTAEAREPIVVEPVKVEAKIEIKATADSDIKTSFIAAARRAAQAAQAELAAEAPLDRHTRARPAAVSPIASRLARFRASADQHRRPMLLGLAAIVLTLGAVGLRSGDDAEPVPQLAQAPDGAPQQIAQADKPGEAPKSVDGKSVDGKSVEASSADAKTADAKTADAGKSGEAAKTADTSKTADASKTAAPASPESATTQAVAAPKQPDASPAPAKPGLPQVAAMTGLTGELATVPPGFDRLKQAALAGDGRAVWELAVREGDGRGMPRDPALASKLFEKLASAGYAPAQYKLGALYEKGTGVTRDLAQAKLWYGRAAEQGHARAMHNLGVIFAENPSPNGKPDFVSAATWFRQGAEHGVRDSQYNIAVLYARGLGLTQDLVQSYSWFSAAAAQGDDDAGKKRDDVATKLSAPDLARAKSLAASFKARKVDVAVNEAPAIQDGGHGPMTLLGAPVPNPTTFVQPARKAI